MNFKAILFDLDGTLLDTLEDLADSMNSVLEDCGFPPHPTENYKVYVGDGTAKLVEKVLPEDHREAPTIARLLTMMQEEYSKRWDKKTRPYEGIAELLDKLTALRLKIVVFSNKPHDFTLLTVEKLLPHWDFDVVWGAKKDIPLKPDPAAALKISADLDIPPEDFLYLGDTDTDMLTANAAGMYAVGALWGFRSADELRDSGAKALISHPADLLELL